jgi:hypothetical protein
VKSICSWSIDRTYPMSGFLAEAVYGKDNQTVMEQFALFGAL